MYHKTYDSLPLDLVPLSGGVFQLMCELTPSSMGRFFSHLTPSEGLTPSTGGLTPSTGRYVSLKQRR